MKQIRHRTIFFVVFIGLSSLSAQDFDVLTNQTRITNTDTGKTLQPSNESSEEENSHSENLSPFALSLQIPLGVGLNITENSGLWPGFVFQPGIEAEYLFGVGEKTTLGPVVNAGYLFEYYQMDKTRYGEGSSIHAHSIVLGTAFRLLLQSWYIDLGMELSWVVGGHRTSDIGSDKLTIDGKPSTSIQFETGYRFILSSGWFIQLGLEGRITPGVIETVPLHIRFSSLVGFRL